jgi:hypothetical protein
MVHIPWDALRVGEAVLIPWPLDSEGRPKDTAEAGLRAADEDGGRVEAAPGGVKTPSDDRPSLDRLSDRSQGRPVIAAQLSRRWRPWK